MKHLVGKQVWLMPTGNNSRRYNNEVKQALVTKVAKVNVSFIMDGYTREEKLRISDWVGDGTLHLHNESNGGFRVFETLQEIEDYNEANMIRQHISGLIRYNKLGDISLDNLRSIYDLIGAKKWKQ